MNGFDVYKEYIALKAHFTKSFDYFKYNGKIRYNFKTFQKRKDKFFFEKLSKHSNPKEFLLANIVDNKDFWIGEFHFNKTLTDTFVSWTKRQQSLSYMYSQEIKLLKENLNDNLISSSGNPYLLQLFYKKKISVETLCIIVHNTKCMKYWNSILKDDPLWIETKSLILKYYPFIKYDKKRIKEINKNYFMINKNAS